MAIDPVCGMYVEEKENAIKSLKYGRTYYFCSESCRAHFERPEREIKKLKATLVLSWILTIPVLILTFFPVLPYSVYVIFSLATINQYYAGFRFYRGIADAFKSRSGNMDTLIAMGTTVAWIFSTIVTFFPDIFETRNIYFDTSSVIISLVLTGTYMESLMKKRAADSIEKLLSLQPSYAHLVVGGDLKEVPVERIKVGDILLVKPGERFPADCIIMDGITDVDESMITGESMPVVKRNGDTVICGTVNKTGAVRTKAIRVGDDTTLSKIIRIVENATSEKVPVQRLVDRISSYFVPAVIFIAFGSFIFWYFLGGVGLTFSILVLVSVLIIACPCALGIATPAALIVASGRASQNGILFKNGEAIEKASRVDTVILDKTGTLTTGHPEVSDIIPLNGNDERSVLETAAIAELQSDHPVGRAIVEMVKGKRDFPEKFEYLPGLGVRAFYRGSKILVGNREFISMENIYFSAEELIEKIEKEGGTALVVACDSQVLGIIGVRDRLRNNAKKAVEALYNMGMDVYLVTGDNRFVATDVASQLNIRNVFSDVKPEGKLRIIEDLQKKGKLVAMVGDGINDSPALAKAYLGIAIGSGTDIAKETGDVILMRDEILDIVNVFRLGRKTMKKIRQNLTWAFVYNSVLIPVAAGLLIPVLGAGIYEFLPILAASAMAFSSTTVVTNSLLLKKAIL